MTSFKFVDDLFLETGGFLAVRWSDEPGWR